MIPKDLSRRLNRLQQVDGKSSASRWNPSERNELDRLMELMMFHQAATGKNYTGLTHRYQPLVDHSSLLETDYAMLIGRANQSLAKVVVQAEQAGDAPEVLSGLDRCWCRILIPVQAAKNRLR
jgi:hypothetical protein